MASLAAAMFSSESWRCWVVLFASIPLYAIDWLIVASLAPCRSNSIGILRSICVGTSWLALSFASLSLSSFPSMLLCPLIHVNAVLADRLLSRYAAFWNHSAFRIPIHPWFSQFWRCVVKPSMTYFESDFISSGQNWGTFCIATITAASSPIWFDW